MSNERPIFILGTGRCGSTYLQTKLCGASDIWIWGEHDGMLTGLLSWSRVSRTSEPMSMYGFPYAKSDPYTTMSQSGTLAAWLSPFDADDLVDVEREVCTSLFSRRLPAGKKRWGFKEIRYGKNSRVPERLLELYPAARFIHVVRHPRKTVSSTIRAWTPEIFDTTIDENSRRELIKKMMSEGLGRWAETTLYFEQFRAQNSSSLMTVQIEQVDQRLSEILQFLEADPMVSPIEVASETNPAPDDEQVSQMINEAYYDFLKDAPYFPYPVGLVGYSL